MMRHFSATSEDSLGRRRRASACSTCLEVTPWGCFLAIALFAAGLAVWVGGAVKLQEYTGQVAAAIDVAPGATDDLRRGTLIAILALGISGIVVCLAAFGLALFRTAQGTMLWSRGGGCCGSKRGPEPWTFTTARVVAALLSAVVWLLLLAVVGVLMVMLAYWAAAVAINSAIASSKSGAGAFGVDVTAATDSVAAARAYLAPLVRSSAAASELLGSATAASLPFQPLCAPVCLNIGSFAQFLRSASCVCGSVRIDALQAAAQAGVRVGAVALAGAAAMYAGATALLMILTGQFVASKADRDAARALQRKAARAYEAGAFAEDDDCVPDDGEAAPVAAPAASPFPPVVAYPPVRPGANPFAAAL